MVGGRPRFAIAWTTVATVGGAPQTVVAVLE